MACLSTFLYESGEKPHEMKAIEKPQITKALSVQLEPEHNTVKNALMLSADVNGLLMCFSSRLWGLHSLHVSGLPQGVRALPSGEFSKKLHSSYLCLCVFVLPEGTHSCITCVPPPSAYLTDRQKHSYLVDRNDVLSKEHIQTVVLLTH